MITVLDKKCLDTFKKVWVNESESECTIEGDHNMGCAEKVWLYQQVYQMQGFTQTFWYFLYVLYWNIIRTIKICHFVQIF